MMAMAENEKKQELVIKKVKKGGHGGHHGGAWKVAYADFVTAMMAFFLLLWLLSTTTPEQRKGIAEYFTPTVGLKDAKGIGFEGGLTPNEKGSSRSSMSNPGLIAGQIAQGPLPKEPVQMKDPSVPQEQESAPVEDSPNVNDDGEKQQTDSKGKDDTEEFRRVQESILNAFEQTPEMRQLRNNVVIANVPEGLKIDLVEDGDRVLFSPGSANMTDTARLMVKAVAGIILRSRNRISVSAHTERLHYDPNTEYTNWELTADRANAVRRYVMQSVLEPERVEKVQGFADQELLLPKEPNSPRNRRVTLTLLRDVYMPNGPKEDLPTEKGLISVPKVDSMTAIAPAPASESSAKAAPAPKEEPVPELGSSSIPLSGPVPDNSGGLLSAPGIPVTSGGKK